MAEDEGRQQPAVQLVRYDAMCRAIDAAYEVDEAKSIRDQAIALEIYARQAHNTEAERKACEIRLRPERKAGELSAKLEKGKPGPKPKDESIPTMGNNSAPAKTKAEALRDAGVTPKQAEQWEKLAANIKYVRAVFASVEFIEILQIVFD